MVTVKKENCIDAVKSDAELFSWTNPKCEVFKEEDRKPDLPQIESDDDYSVSDGESDEDILNNKIFDLDDKSKSVENEGKIRRDITGNKGLPISKPSLYHSWVEALEHAPVCNYVSNQCEFQCTKCPLVFTSRGYLYRHLRKIHVGQGMKDFKKYLVKIVAHKCQICSKKVFCEKMSISCHVKTHGIHSLQAYCDKKEIEYENKCVREEASQMPKKKRLFRLQSWVERLELAPVSDTVDNLCVFECKKCKARFQCRSHIRRHLRRSNHAIASLSHINDYLITIKGYHCIICNKKLVCDKTSIVTHLKSHDETYTLKKYFSEMNAKHEQTSLAEREFNHFCALQKCEVSKHVLNLCIFSCLKCKLQFRTWFELRQHIKRNSHGPLARPLQHVKEAKLYKCQVCTTLFFCDTKLIQNHIYFKHKLTLSKYFQINNLPNLEEVYQMQVRLAIKDIPAFQPKLHHSHPDQNTLLDDQATKHVGNMTIFKCSQCGKQERSYLCLSNHYKTIHQTKLLIHEMDNVGVAEARYHKCHICAENVLSDRAVIRRHISKRHNNMKMTPYINNYVLKNGYKVVPTFHDFNANNRIFENFWLN